MTSANYEAHGLGFDIYNDTQVYKYWKVLDAARALAANAPLQDQCRPSKLASSVLAQLRHGLQTGPGNLSQVWTASIPAAYDTLLWANYTNPEDLAGNEAWVYEALQEKQGLSISDIQNACIAGLDTVREITCAGFALEDIRAPNFILTGQPDARAVVAIDFYGAQRIRPGVDVAKVTANDEIDFFSNFAPCARVHYPDIYQGAKEQLPRHIWAR
ncbi:hypothetical protein C8J57DRAFT_1513425 [Mycena rebaudengoi]|nr:hypothetical protein C8J57DRAFT_1513425 [Mycena rebaudengoi]